MNKIKYEYLTVAIDTTLHPDEAVAALNKLGAEGWKPIAYVQGSYNDDVAHGRMWLMREKE